MPITVYTGCVMHSYLHIQSMPYRRQIQEADVSSRPQIQKAASTGAGDTTRSYKAKAAG